MGQSSSDIWNNKMWSKAALLTTLVTQLKSQSFYPYLVSQFNNNYAVPYSYFLNPYSYLTPQVYGVPSFIPFQNFQENQVVAKTVSPGSDVIAAAPLLNVIDEKPKSQKANLQLIGELPEFAPKQHPMRGTVYFNPANQSQIIVKDFYYPQVT